MSKAIELRSYVKSVEEAVTYLESPSVVLDRLDLGSAEVVLSRGSDGYDTITILTSSGHAVCIPAEVFSLLR